jgi:stage II sporulation protein D
VLVHNGRLIDAVFHSSSGGVTEASGMVWRQQLPYLVSVPDHDQHSPVHRWQERFDPATLRTLLPETGGLDRVDVLSRSGSGRVQQIRVVGPRGQLMLTGRELRQRLSLKSTLVDFERVTALQKPPLRPLPPLPVSAPVAASKPSRIDQITASVAEITGSKNTATKNRAAKPRSVLRAPAPSLLPASVAKLPAEGWQLLVRGQGYGHGVGMSQWGAHGLAEQGADFRTILRHYYRGADVVPFRAVHDPALAMKPPVAPLWRG